MLFLCYTDGVFVCDEMAEDAVEAAVIDDV